MNSSMTISPITHRALVIGATFVIIGANFTLAQSPGGKKTAHDLGPIHFTAGHSSISGLGKAGMTADITSGFTMTSAQYNVSGSVAHIEYGAKTVQKITADGTPDRSKQVEVIFTSDADATGARFLADHAVMVPSPASGHPEQQKLTFTGHVTMFLMNRAALQEPSKSTMEKAVVYVGDGPEYPKLEADSFDLNALPAPGN